MAAAITGVAATLTAEQSAQFEDDCDAATFNAVIGDGTCNPNAGGDTTFDEFVADVLAQQGVDEWRFNPDRMSDPRNIVAQNRGGETHSFTRVTNFGGGSIAPPLNELLGTTAADIPRECLADLAAGAKTFVPTGGPLSVNDVKGGDKFQCCIHPWMRTTVRKR